VTGIFKYVHQQQHVNFQVQIAVLAYRFTFKVVPARLGVLELFLVNPRLGQCAIKVSLPRQSCLTQLTPTVGILVWVHSLSCHERQISDDKMFSGFSKILKTWRYKIFCNWWCKLESMKRKVSINRTLNVLDTYFVNEMNFSSLFGITVIFWLSWPSSVIIRWTS